MAGLGVIADVAGRIPAGDPAATTGPPRSPRRSATRNWSATSSGNAAPGVHLGGRRRRRGLEPGAGRARALAGARRLPDRRVRHVHAVLQAWPHPEAEAWYARGGPGSGPGAQAEGAAIGAVGAIIAAQRGRPTRRRPDRGAAPVPAGQPRQPDAADQLYRRPDAWPWSRQGELGEPFDQADGRVRDARAAGQAMVPEQRVLLRVRGAGPARPVPRASSDGRPGKPPRARRGGHELGEGRHQPAAARVPPGRPGRPGGARRPAGDGAARRWSGAEVETAPDGRAADRVRGGAGTGPGAARPGRAGPGPARRRASR